LIKTIPLTIAILKEFIRNWKSIILLIIFPLALISTVFLSFNPDGIQKIPVGVVGVSDGFNIDNYEDTYFSYLSIKKYYDLGTCLYDLKVYKQYACLDVIQNNTLFLTVYYDNTREPVIWEIIERIKSTIDLLQKERSKQMASDFLSKFSSNMKKAESFKVQLIDINSRVANYIQQTDYSINNLATAKSELSQTIYSMDSDISNLKYAKDDLKIRKNNFHSNAISYLNNLDSYSYSFSNLSTNSEIANSLRNQATYLRNEIERYDQLSDSNLNQVENKIFEYEQKSNKGKQYVSDIDAGILQLTGVRNDLQNYQSAIKSTENELTTIQNEFKDLEGLDPDALVNPIIINNNPTYIPKVASQYYTNGSFSAQKIIKGVNLISLQTIFPTMLLLITLFLSLLISGFICLSEINGPAQKRRILIPGIFFPEIIAVYISSMIIMIIPLICVLILGNYLFAIPIFDHLPEVSIIILLLSSIFILMGSSLAYLIKNESITLLITTFLLVFFIFLSGFILPIERMSNWANIIASSFPAKLSLSAFNKVVFYNQGFSAISGCILGLTLWFSALFIASNIIKKIRNV
jgi:hypothetical protein